MLCARNKGRQMSSTGSDAAGCWSHIRYEQQDCELCLFRIFKRMASRTCLELPERKGVCRQNWKEPLLRQCDSCIPKWIIGPGDQRRRARIRLRAPESVIGSADS